MANFSDFLPAAGGGGGFTKMLKYTTARGLNDANYNNAASYTVNPATDLGLSDGDSIGYMLIGSGENKQDLDVAGAGGKIIQGTSIISNASTNLTLTPGTGNGVASTISGGLTLTSADGIKFWGGMTNNVDEAGSASTGIMGYGAGGGSRLKAGGMRMTAHGWGNGEGYESSSGDGAILLFY